MARRRFFVDRVRNGVAVIEGESAHHLTRVLRVESGQKYEITDTERVWLAEVTTARKALVEFTVVEEIDPGLELPPVTLYLALIKFERFEWAVEKATELGVARIVPVDAERTDRGLAEGARKRVDRWRRIAREASEQSRRLRAPQIDDPMPFEQLLGCDYPDQRLWLEERPGAPPLMHALTPGPASFAIGPEGGWSDDERNWFEESLWRPASLGPSILRAETAVCAALAVWIQISYPAPDGNSADPRLAGNGSQVVDSS